MKKIFTLIFCLVSLGASAQQVNGGFDETWEDCYPWAGGKKGNTAYGKNPKGWTISNVPENSVDILGSETTDENGGRAVKITNKSNSILSSQKIPAYITLGTTWATAETCLTSIRNADGGTFGGIQFGYKPDGIRFKYKRSSTNASQPASVIVYMWNGTWEQASVPSNTAVGALSWGSATKVTMTNRERNILGMTTTTGGSITSTSDAKLLFSFQGSITEDVSTWTTYEQYFNWGDNANEDVSNAKLNIIIAANDYFGDRTAIIGDNSLTIDNVELIYNSSLSDLQFNETTVHGFAKDNYNYYVAGNYTEGCITYTKDCVGGSATGSWNETTGVYTITVKGDDWSETNLNEHTYTVTFVDCIIEDGVTDIESLIGTSNSKILLKRNFKAGWNTICLPFGSNKSYLGDGAEVYKLTTSSTNSDVITFTNNGTAALMANNPYLIYLPTAISNIVYTGRSITSTTIKTIAHNNWIFAGNYTQNMSMEGKWGVVNEGGKVRKGGSSSTLKGTRAYFTNKNNTAGVNEMRFIIDDAETNITEIDGEPLSYDVYNLNGMLVRKNATDLNGLRKGIYIVNGKKYIVK